MNLHEFPWPRTELEQLGETEVELRVTLSYYIEPNPGERGWLRRHRYASHALRFAVKRELESLRNSEVALTPPLKLKRPAWLLSLAAQTTGSLGVSGIRVNSFRSLVRTRCYPGPEISHRHLSHWRLVERESRPQEVR